jgi:hypothetical protein
MRYDFKGVYNMLTRAAAKTDRSAMTPEIHRDWLTIIDRAQKIVRLEAEQAGVVIP